MFSAYDKVDDKLLLLARIPLQSLVYAKWYVSFHFEPKCIDLGTYWSGMQSDQ